MSKYFFIAITLFIGSIVFGQDKPAYSIFDSNGKKVTYKKMIKALEEKDIVLFGEYHDNPIVHWLQLEVTVDLDKSRDLVLAAEASALKSPILFNIYWSQLI